MHIWSCCSLASSDLSLCFRESPQFSAWLRRFSPYDFWPSSVSLFLSLSPPLSVSFSYTLLSVSQKPHSLSVSGLCSDIPFVWNVLSISCSDFTSLSLHIFMSPPKPRHQGSHFNYSSYHRLSQYYFYYYFLNTSLDPYKSTRNRQCTCALLCPQCLRHLPPGTWQVLNRSLMSKQISEKALHW